VREFRQRTDAHFLYADGTVRFVSNNISVVPGGLSINGGEVIKRP
jgi:hypothetical protein